MSQENSLHNYGLYYEASGVQPDVLHQTMLGLRDKLSFYCETVNDDRFNLIVEDDQLGCSITVSDQYTETGFGFMPWYVFQSLSDQHKQRYKDNDKRLGGTWLLPNGSGKGFIQTRGGYVDLFMRLLLVKLSKQFTIRCVDSDDNIIVSPDSTSKAFLSLEDCSGQLHWKMNQALVKALDNDGYFGGYQHHFKSLREVKANKVIPDLAF